MFLTIVFTVPRTISSLLSGSPSFSGNEAFAVGAAGAAAVWGATQAAVGVGAATVSGGPGAGAAAALGMPVSQAMSMGSGSNGSALSTAAAGPATNGSNGGRPPRRKP